MTEATKRTGMEISHASQEPSDHLLELFLMQSVGASLVALAVSYRRPIMQHYLS